MYIEKNPGFFPHSSLLQPSKFLELWRRFCLLLRRGSGSEYCLPLLMRSPDPDHACHFDVDPDPAPRLPNKRSKPWKSAQIGSYWLVICKFMRMRIRIRIQLITLMRTRIRILIELFTWCGSGSGSYPSMWCGSGSATLVPRLWNVWKAIEGWVHGFSSIYSLWMYKDVPRLGYSKRIRH
jgi:hypothetical protein